MLKVTIVEEIVNPASWQVFDNVEELLPFLKSYFGDKFPDTARLYHNTIATTCDVTPSDEMTISRLAGLKGEFFVVVYPGYVAIPYILGALLAVAGILLATKPSVPQPPISTQRNEQASSPNNGLSDRQNQPRINGRIPDIFGTVRSTPDLIAAPYNLFENGREVEYAYMCIGRGAYDISDVRDGDTLVANIPGTTVMVYGPTNSPNNFDPNFPDVNPPQLIIGAVVQTPVLSAKRSNSVNGQVLRPPNTATFVGNGNVKFTAPNLVELPPDSAIDFTKYFVDGDTLTFTNTSATAGTSVTQRLVSRATQVNFTQVYSGGTKTYDTIGAIVFELDNPVESGINQVNNFFQVGATLVIVTVQGNSRQRTGVIDGTYTITDISLQGPANAAEQAANIPHLFVVKLDDPASVNSGWNTMSTSPGIKDAYEFTLVATMESSLTYNINLNGTYTALSVLAQSITLDNPIAVNSDWSIVATKVSTPYLTPTITASGDKWVGPFILEDPNLLEVYTNFIAENGLYEDDGTTQTALDIEVELELTPVDVSDTAIGDPEYFTLILEGSSFLKESVAATLKAHPSTFFGRCQVRARRVSDSDTGFTGTVVDEVRWRDAYSIAHVAQSDFGNVTTVFSVTFATASALAVKERKLNMLVTRKLPSRLTGNMFTDAVLTATTSADDILVAICRDRYIGNRPIEEIDVDSIYDTVAEIETYFGTPSAKQFNYTFDNDNLSFEETVASVANAIFCVAYRRGSVIKISLEKQTDDSTLLFNHRNKIPGSEKRTLSFGYLEDNDGIEYTYVSPDDDSIISVFLPQSFAAVNAKKVDSVGVRNHLQAYFQAWRVWQKIQYQNTQTQFDATQEADLLVQNDRILVADNTRQKTQDGEVLAVDVLELTLSQNVDLTEFGSYQIFLQLFDGTVQGIAITAGSAPNKVVLGSAPALELVADKDTYAKTTYVIVGDTESQQTAFLVSEKSASAGLTSTVTAINYDDRYYSKDSDFINGFITEDGYGPTGGFTINTGDTYTTGGLFQWVPRAVHFITSRINCIAFNGTDQWIVIAATGKISTSPDAATWTLQTSGETASLNSVAWSSDDSIWVIVGALHSGSNMYVITSPDGITWTQRSITPPTGQVTLTGVAFKAGVGFVAVSAGTSDGTQGNHWTSADGITWTNQTTYQNRGWGSLIYDGTNFVGAVHSTGDHVVFARSADGVSWTESAAATELEPYPPPGSLAYGGDKYIASNIPNATTGDHISLSASSNWSGSLHSLPFIPNAVGAGNGLYIAGGATDSFNAPKIASSPNGSDWTEEDSEFALDEVTFIAFGQGGFVAGGKFGNLSTRNLPPAVTANLVIRSTADQRIASQAGGGDPADQILGDFGTIVGGPPLYQFIFEDGGAGTISVYSGCAISNFQFSKIVFVDLGVEFDVSDSTFHAGCGQNRWDWPGRSIGFPISPATVYRMLIVL